MKILKILFIFIIILTFCNTSAFQAQTYTVKKKQPVSVTSQLSFIRKNTSFIIKKLYKHLPATLNECRLAKWTMKAPKPAEDPSHDVFASVWTTTFDGMRIKINSSVSPGYEGLIIAGIKLTINVPVGYDKKKVHDWIIRRYGSNTRVGSTAYSIEYMTNCWFVFKLYQKKVIIQLKWM